MSGPEGRKPRVSRGVKGAVPGGRGPGGGPPESVKGTAGRGPGGGPPKGVKGAAGRGPRVSRGAKTRIPPGRAGRRLFDSPPAAALEALLAVEGGRLPEEALADVWALLDAKGRARASAIVYETVRHRLRLDNVVRAALSRGRAEPGPGLILRMAVAQLMFLDRTPDHVVVDGSVELAKRLWPGREGLVNAVLRRILKGRGEGAWPREPIPAWADTDAKRLAILYSHPVWLAERLAAEGGVRGARAVMAANNRPVPPTIRVNPLKGTREDLEGVLGFETFRTPLSPWGLAPRRPAGAPESWPGFGEGLFAIQDEASQILGLLVGSPKTILDACAGLGGKTMAMAAAAPEAAITAVDLDGRRLKALTAEGLRLGLPRPPETIKGDFRSALGGGALFDLVVLDAPCTGLGVIRRRPDLKWAREAGDPARLGAEQLGLLEAAADRVTPGGRLIYSVCSEAPEEGPEALKAFLQLRGGDFRPWGREELPETLRPLWSEPGSLRLSTRLHGTDGFYYGLLSRSGGRRTAKSGRKREKNEAKTP